MLPSKNADEEQQSWYNPGDYHHQDDFLFGSPAVYEFSIWVFYSVIIK